MMFVLLMKVRLLSGRNVALDIARKSPLIALGLSLMGVSLFLAMALGFWVFFLFAGKLNVLTETVYQIFYFLFLFLLAGAVPFIASTLLHSSDYTLLYSSPVPPRAVIAAKLLDATVTNSLQFTVLGIPAIVACAGALGLPLLGWLLIPFIIALFVLLPALLTALGLLLLLALVGMRRLRSAITALNAIMALTVCITIVLEARHLPVKNFAFNGMMSGLPASVYAPSPTAHFAPSGWFAAALLALAAGEWASLALDFGKILLIVGLLFAGCLALGGHLLTAANVAEENGQFGMTGPTHPKKDGTFWGKVFAAPVAALIAKDFKYLYRDSVLLSQLAMPLILFIVPFLLAVQDSALQLREEMLPFAIVMTGVILFMQTSILSLSSIGLESQSFWVVLTSPNGGRTLLWAKFLMSTLVSGVVGLTLSLFTGLVFGLPFWGIAIQLLIVLLTSGALCGLGVGISAAFPRFFYENPAHRVSAWALILGFFATVGYLLLTGVLFGLAWLFSLHTDPGSQTLLLWSLSLALYIGFSLFAIFLPLAIGARRIERYQWEH